MDEVESVQTGIEVLSLLLAANVILTERVKRAFEEYTT